MTCGLGGRTMQPREKKPGSVMCMGRPGGWTGWHAPSSVASPVVSRRAPARQSAYPQPVRVVATLALVTACALGASVGGAQPALPKPAPPAGPKTPETKPSVKPEASAAQPVPARSKPAVATVAEALAEALPKLEGSVVVAVAPLDADVKAPRGEALALLVAAQLSGRRGWSSPTRTEPLEGAVVRARRSTAVVFLRVRVERGRLLATADVHPVPPTVWARVRNPAPGPVAHAFAEAPLDAEVRSHLEPVPLVSPVSMSVGRAFESQVLALACGDLDRDGAHEIVSVSPDRVTLVRLREGKAAPVVARPWSDLSPMDPTPLREPVAAALVSSPSLDDTGATREVVVSITDRWKSARLGPSLDLVASHVGFAVPDGGSFSCARFEAPTVTGPLEACSAATLPPRRASVGGRYDAVAGAQLVTADGRPFEVWAGREDGGIEIFDDSGATAKLPSGGAQLALGDLNQDGTPELLTTLDVERGTPDAIVVYSWDRSRKAPVEKLRVPVAAGVQALGVCPPDGPGRAPFVFATPAEIVVAR